MAVGWTPHQEKLVNDQIATFPIDSDRCGDLARGILPVARCVEAGAHGLRVKAKPGQGFYVEPRIGGRSWRCHVLVSVVAHGVDALTGSPGTPIGEYLGAHWKHVECLDLLPSDLVEPICR